jgi:histidinol-phosphate aminotransferase
VRVRTTEGNGLPGHLRVTIGLPEENRRFIDALDEVLSCG